MALVVVGSAKGGAGATATGLGLAAMSGDGLDGVFVEADILGGDVQLHFGVRDAPGLVSLAAAAHRSGLSGALLREHAQALPGGALVVAAPAAVEQAGAAVELLDSAWSEAELDDVLVFADAGALARHPAPGLLARADAVVLVCSGLPASLAHAADVASRWTATGKPVVLAVRGACSYTPERLSAQLDVSVCALLPEDPVDALLLRGARVPPRGRLPWRRPDHALMTALKALHTSLLDLLPQVMDAGVDPAATEPVAMAEPLDQAMTALGR
ncbi:hypothetical protein [Streptacidiphilus sp. MAP5-3]|uniref:hypothetical protein n=1 Tax=unclassified Streptacidiphilus TaxID=2643834 RepID=UPI003518F256